MSRRDGEATRKRILACARRNPGIHKSDLCEELGLAWGTVSHHLRILRQQGDLQLVREGRKLCLFPSGQDLDDLRWAALLRDEICSSLVRGLEKQPGARLADLADRLGVSRKVVRRHLDNLEEERIIQHRGEYQRRYELDHGAARRLGLEVPEPEIEIEPGTPVFDLAAFPWGRERA